MRENEGKREKGKQAGELKAFMSKFIASSDCLFKALIEQGKLQKYLNYQNNIEGSLGKSYKKVVKKIGSNKT